MIWLKRHPSWRELNRLSDDELDADSRRPAMEHVVACPQCSRRMSFLRSLREAGLDMRHPSPPRELLDDIMRSRSEGRRVILPAIPPAPRSQRRMLPAAAAVAIMAGLAVLASVFLASEAGAGASELTVDPARPVPGEEIQLSYRPTTELAGEMELRLRLRLRRPDSEPPRGTLGMHEEVVLRPGGDGRYVGSFRLPPDFAFATMAVENLSGDRLDDRDGRLWSLRAHTDGGVPRLEALRQEFLVLEKRSWPEAGEALHEMTLFYPDRAEGWSLELAHEGPTQLPDEAAASLAKHREIFRRLEAQTERIQPSADDVAAMARYAAALEDEAAFGRWLTRLEALAPAHRLILSAALAELGSEPARADAYLERLWSDDGLRTSTIYREGFRIAMRAGDMETARRWALRGLPVDDDHVWARDAALALVAHPETRERGISEIRILLEHVEENADEERTLHSTPDEVRRGSRRMQATLRVRLAEQLLAAGEPDAAILELEAADGLGGWLSDLHRARLEASLLRGDTVAALSDFHRLQVDPVYPRDSVDSLRQRLPLGSPADAQRGRARAEREMVQRVLAQQDTRRGLPDLSLFTPTGSSRSVSSLVAGRPTVLMVWDRRVFGSPGDAAEIVRARNVLAGGAAQLLWVTPEPDSEALQVFTREAGIGIQAYHDPGSELATTLAEWGRGYFVIDRAGTIRIRTDSLMEAVRHLEVLRLGSRDTT